MNALLTPSTTSEFTFDQKGRLLIVGKWSPLAIFATESCPVATMAACMDAVALPAESAPKAPRPADKRLSAMSGEDWNLRVWDRAGSDLQTVVRGAIHLAGWLGTMAPESMSPDVRDTLEALRPLLDVAVERKDNGELLGNGELLAIASESAHLLASMMDPTNGMDMATLPQLAQEAADGLLKNLWHLGLMDAYELSGHRFGIWGEPD